ncbi:methylase [Propionibacterium sp. NM47_B9-13]|uniref:Methyltransferase n=1 Tax=Cutibacterium modestum TaxID=2559073 RepID=A0AAD1KPJ1_9ACTN|nr:RsmD family RNA methyltransferase [Cutibacterium modestum]MCP2375048.1 RNA methyltransferase, RsmD family protein [Cutibacterium modestum 28N]MCP2379834.1 RNA methyltransferase, RsmD family protein [Cutibacterium modestum 30N]TGY27979.1 methylase [Propionibacterium sp. NM47_B9-13]EGG27756.1 RNA methyltransferase, RsmD family [Cutibacterium modestum P08]MCP2377255.1 RNA methyltransferase, RsmD family protein [Cutibacterium modestum 31N]
MSRIIAGRAGGQRLATPSGRLTRPTTDRVREAVFSALAAWNGTANEAPEDQLAGQAFCDLFAGSGAMALEAASRGATTVFAVDRDRFACNVMRDNSRTTRLRIQVSSQTVTAFLAENRRVFDIVWFDPPYDLADDAMDGLIAAACERTLARNGLLVVERSRRSRGPGFPEGYESWNSRYGETVVYYAQCRREPETDVSRGQQ